jgi:hypothetical protein
MGDGQALFPAPRLSSRYLGPSSMGWKAHRPTPSGLVTSSTSWPTSRAARHGQPRPPAEVAAALWEMGPHPYRRPLAPPDLS